MAHTIVTSNLEQVKQIIAGPGYAAVVCYRNNDWPSQLMQSRCCAYAREYPFVRFCSLNVDECTKQDLAPFSVSFVPTVILYRNGVRRIAVIGTNYSEMRRYLDEARIDGSNIAPAHPSNRFHRYVGPPHPTV